MTTKLTWSYSATLILCGMLMLVISTSMVLRDIRTRSSEVNEHIALVKSAILRQEDVLTTQASVLSNQTTLLETQSESFYKIEECLRNQSILLKNQGAIKQQLADLGKL